MPASVCLVVSYLTHLVRAPAALLVRLSDDADEIWEPFLSDPPADLRLEAV